MRINFIQCLDHEIFGWGCPTRRPETSGSRVGS